MAKLKKITLSLWSTLNKHRKCVNTYLISFYSQKMLENPNGAFFVWKKINFHNPKSTVKENPT